MTDVNEQANAPSRRNLLRGAAVGGAVVATAAVGAGTAAAVSGGNQFRRESLVFEVACLGQTWRDSPVRNPADDADFRTPFSVEGYIYPDGTTSEGFIPTLDGVIGHWLCRGWIMIDGERFEPHTFSDQLYTFGLINPDRVFPPDTLTSLGLEGTFDMSQVSSRSVTGGTGQYFGANGQVNQSFISTNSTVFDDGSGDNALNFRFEFDLLLPKS